MQKIAFLKDWPTAAVHLNGTSGPGAGGVVQSSGQDMWHTSVTVVLAGWTAAWQGGSAFQRCACKRQSRTVNKMG